MKIGKCFKKLNNIESAVKSYENAIANNINKDYLCFYKLGQIKFKENKTKEAIDNYLKALSLNSTDIKILIKLGQIYLEHEKEENHIDEAFYYLTEAI